MSYGKFFSSCFTGSMVGAGLNVFAVWAYVIAHTVKGQVELNPRLLAAILGCEEADVSSAIDYLCRPDPDSRNKEFDGKRLIKVGQFAYNVVSHDIYRAMQDEEDRREYNRLKQKEYRERKKSKKRKNTHGNALPDVTDCVDKHNASAFASASGKSKEGLLGEIYEAYPRRVGRPKAIQSIEKAINEHGAEFVLERTKMFAAVAAKFTKEQAGFIPHPTTWFNQQRYNDDPSTWERHDNGNGGCFKNGGGSEKANPRNAAMGLTRADEIASGEKYRAILDKRKAAFYANPPEWARDAVDAIKRGEVQPELPEQPVGQGATPDSPDGSNGSW